MIKNAFLLFTLILFRIAATAQSLYLDKTFLPPTPTAYNMTKFGDFQPSLHTGTNVVTIPLFKIKTNNLELPMTLNYASNGVKVDELPGICGLSWLFKYGGIISREINDQPDRIVNAPNLVDILPRDVVKAISTDDDRLFLRDYLMKGAEEGADSEPDVFSLNSQFGSARFIISAQGEIIAERQSDLKITLLENTGVDGGFLLTDGSGVKYYFDQKEISSTASGSSQRLTAATAWYLGRVIDPTGEEISISYEKKIYGGAYAGIERKVTTQVIGASFTESDEYIRSQQGTFPAVNSLFTFEGLFPKTIQSRNELITFQYTNVGSTGTISLSTIDVKNKNNEIIDQIDFDYLSTSNGRIFLSAVNSRNNGKYTFSYIYPETFPERFSKMQDHWGYYNNAANQTLLPQNDSFGTISDRSPNNKYASYGMLNAIVYPTGGMSQFTYELNRGSVSEYKFGYKVTDIRGKGYEFATNEMVKGSPFIAEFSGEMKIQFGTVGLAPECESSSDPDILKFRIVIKLKDLNRGVYVKEETFYKGSFSDRIIAVLEKGRNYQVEMYMFGCVKADLIFNYDGHPIKIDSEKELGGVRIAGIENRDLNQQVTKKSFMYKKINSSIGSGISYDEPINYMRKETLGYFFVTPSDPSRPYPATQYVKYLKNTLQSKADNLFDLRGNSVVYNAVVEVGEGGATEYFFRCNYDSKAIAVIKNSEIDSYDYIYNNSSWGNGEIDSINYYSLVDSNYELIKQKKNLYAYSTEQSRKFDFYKVISKYLTYGNVNFPSQPVYPAYFDEFTVTNTNKNISYPFYVCEAAHEHIWKVDSDGYKKCVQADNLSKQHRFLSPFYGKVVGSKLSMSKTEHLEARMISFYSHRYNLVEEREYDYRKNEVLGYTRSIFYDNPDHFNATRQVQINSRGEQIITSITYPMDYSDNNVIIKELKAKHMVNLPIERVTFKKSGAKDSIISGELIEYQANGKILKVNYLPLSKIVNKSEFKFSNLAEGIVPPNVIGNYSPDPKYKSHHHFRLYDTYGNLLEVVKNALPVTSYLWAYNGKYPVVEIKNATYAEVVTVLTQAAIDNLNNYSHNDLTMESLIKNAADKLRAGLPNAMVTSYTYKPLVGMTSKTDPRGVKETYKYDSMQRLQAILDHIGHVTKAIDYHYRPN